MSRLSKDLGHGFRLLARNPLFAGIAVLTLALGIGATTAVFSVVHGVLLEPLPYPDPERLVMIWMRFDAQGIARSPVSGPEWNDLATETELFTAVGGIWARFGDLGGSDDPEMVDLGWVTPGFFEALGTPPLVGRTFLREETLPNAAPAIIIDHDLWQRRFGGDRGVIGRSVVFRGEPATIVGVMPPGFQVLAPPEAALPSRFGVYLPWNEDLATLDRTWRRWSAVGRLRPGIGVERAQAELDALALRLRERHAEYAESGLAIEVVPLHEDFVAPVRPALLLLLGAAGFLVLIACSNVAGLLLVRAAARDREMALRTALGAARGRVLRQVLTENLALFLIGGVAGLGVAWVAQRILLAVRPAHLPHLGGVGFDLPTLGFTLAAVLLSGLVFGAVPALQAVRTNLTPALKEGGRTTEGGARHRLRSLLVIAEVTLSLVLLVGALLVLRSFVSLLRVDPGFDPEKVLTLKTALPGNGYPYEEQEKISAFYDRLLERVSALPGVESAGAISNAPLSNAAASSDPYSYETPTGEVEWGTLAADYRSVTEDYFRAMGIRLVAGRFFTPHDDLAHPVAVIVDEQLARTAWPDRDPVGQRLKITTVLYGRAQVVWAEVVGVVSHVRDVDLAVAGREQIYQPQRQSPRRAMTLTVRTALDLETLGAAIRQELRAIDPDRPIFDLRPMTAFVEGATARIRFTFQLIGLFAFAACVLAAVGVYGVVASTVRQMKQEIAIRMAIGATRPQILLQVLGRGLRLVGVGVVVGLAVALAAARVMEGIVYGVSVRDALAFTVAILLTAAVALVACWLPARRASRLDPATALRGE